MTRQDTDSFHYRLVLQSNTRLIKIAKIIAKNSNKNTSIALVINPLYSNKFLPKP